MTSSGAKETPTAGQARALQHLDVFIEDPASWLPTSAWEDVEMRPYVPTRYDVSSPPTKGSDSIASWAPGPQEPRTCSARWPRGTLEVVPHSLGPGLDVWCSYVTVEEARTLATILEDAHLAHRDLGSEPVYVPGGLEASEVSIMFLVATPARGGLGPFAACEFNVGGYSM